MSLSLTICICTANKNQLIAVAAIDPNEQTVMLVAQRCTQQRWGSRAVTTAS